MIYSHLGVRSTKKPQILPYFGPRAHNEVSEGKLQNFEKKVQCSITGAFFNPDTKCYTILKSSGQCGFDCVRPTAHRENFGHQVYILPDLVKITPPMFVTLYKKTPPPKILFFPHFCPCQYLNFHFI